jgi:ectoine hydroxylase-related dioxygenase (phytanoyl-CoA dioxygenase family)
MEFRPEAWRRAYEDDGFVVVPGLLEPAVLARLRDGMDAITGNLDGLRPRLREKIFLERDHVRNNPQWYAGVLTPEQCGQSVRQIADLALFGPAFAEVLCHPPLLDVLEALFASPEFSFSLLVGRPKAARVGNGVRDGKFHRDSPTDAVTSPNTIIAILCLDDMGAANGGTAFIRGSHRVSDEEAVRPCWNEVDPERFRPEERVVPVCPAGSGLFFSSKTLHAAGHNRSDAPRRTLLSEWAGPGVLPTSAERHAYQGLKPRSQDPACQKQMRLTFPQFVAGGDQPSPRPNPHKAFRVKRHYFPGPGTMRRVLPRAPG